MKTTCALTALLLFSALLSGPAPAAPVAISGPMIYTQDFDTMFMPTTPGSVTSSWSDDSTIPGWWFHYSGEETGPGWLAGSFFTHDGNNGSVTHRATLNSAGQPGSRDRAFATPSNGDRSEQSGIVIFQNTGTEVLLISQIQYSGEVYRTNSTANVLESIVPHFWVTHILIEALTLRGSARSAAEAAFIYPPSIATSPTYGNYLTGWTRIPQAIFTYSSPDAATQKTGTGPDSFPINATDLKGIHLPPGMFLAIRFTNPNDSGTDALMGIDDLRVTFEVPPPAIEAQVSNVIRNDKDTPGDPTDDTITFALTVLRGTGTWDADPPLSDYGPASGPFDTPVTYSNVPISQFSPTPPYALLTEFSVAQFIFEPSVIIYQDAFTVYAPGVDTDRDGMPDDYEAAHGLVNGTDDAALDADGDGQPNVAEYQAGTAASNPADALRIRSIAKTGTPGVFAVTLASVPGKRYQLQKSSDLGTAESWSATGPATNAAAAPATTTTLQATLSGSHQFLRAMVLP